MNATRWFEASPLEALLESAALRRANGLSNETRARIEPWLRAAERRYRTARELRSDDRLPVALGLLRAAIRLALAALRAERGEDARDAGERERWTIIDALPSGVELPAGLIRVREAFANLGELDLDSLPLHEARALRVDAEAAAGFLIGQADVRTPAQIRRSRLVRVVLGSLLVLLTLAALVVYVQALQALNPR